MKTKIIGENGIKRVLSNIKERFVQNETIKGRIIENRIDDSGELKVPEGALYASINTIGGRSYALNQLWDRTNYKVEAGDENMFKLYSASGTNTAFYYPTSVAEADRHAAYVQSPVAIANVPGHKYYCIIYVSSSLTGDTFEVQIGDPETHDGTSVTSYKGSGEYCYAVITAKENSTTDRLRFYLVPEYSAKYKYVKIKIDNDRINVVDLTEIFGAGKEPNTVEEVIAEYSKVGLSMDRPRAYDPGSVEHHMLKSITYDKTVIDATARTPDQPTPLYPNTILSKINYLGETYAGNSTITWKGDNDFDVTTTKGYGIRFVYSASPKAKYTMSGYFSGIIRYSVIMYDRDWNIVSRAYEDDYVSFMGTTREYHEFSFETTEDTALIACGWDHNWSTAKVTGFTIAEEFKSPLPIHRASVQVIPEAVQNLPGYGMSSWTKANVVYKEGEKWYYRREVVLEEENKMPVDLEIPLLYEITDLVGHALDPVDVVPGGVIIFEQNHNQYDARIEFLYGYVTETDDGRLLPIASESGKTLSLIDGAWALIDETTFAPYTDDEVESMFEY